ncbi:MAG: ParB/RepB/Spo0J family partition protein [Chloroflexi bacterium]|nr:ParB/RepB/Spo0J family partition protein [Chloroflexota bacterium]
MPPTKHGLGRGLGALIPPGTPPTQVPGVRETQVASVSPNPMQPRHHFDPDALRDLADSIREHGLIQPLIVTPAPDSTELAPRYQLIAGERRWQAAKLAGLESVPVVVRGATPQEMLELALVENIQRADLNPLEEANAYRQLMSDFGLTQEEVAAKVGKNRTTVANALRLLKLPEDIRAAIADEAITEGHARAILTVADEIKQKALLRAVIEAGLSVRQTEEAARRAIELSKPNAGRRAHPERSGAESKGNREEREMPVATRALESDFRSALGTKVQVFRSRKGGKVVLHFYSEEELEVIYEKIVGRK